MLKPTLYTPEEVAQILKLNKNTVYELIKSGEIVAKRIGRVYRVPARSLSFVFTGLDEDLYAAEKEDLRTISKIQKELKQARTSL